MGLYSFFIKLVRKCCLYFWLKSIKVMASLLSLDLGFGISTVLSLFSSIENDYGEL